MTRLVVVSALLLTLFACKIREAPAESPEPSNVVEAPAADPAEALVEPGVAETEPALAEPVDAPVEQPVAANPVAAEAVGVLDPEPVQPARDLGSELRAAVGSPADCLRDYRPASAKTIRVDVRAVVRPTGMVIEPSASGGGLSANDLRCVEQRVGNVVLPSLGGADSQHISTFVNIEYQPAVVEEYDVGAPTPKLKDVVQPLPKKEPIAPSGKPIEGPAADPIEGPDSVPIEGPKGVPIQGPKPKPIDGY